jgi:hypothetical protein
MAASGHRDLSRGEKLKDGVGIGIGGIRRDCMLMNQGVQELHCLEKLRIIEVGLCEMVLED